MKNKKIGREMKRELKTKQALALSQIFMFILSSFAFAFILGGMGILSLEVVSGANSNVIGYLQNKNDKSIYYPVVGLSSDRTHVTILTDINNPNSQRTVSTTLIGQRSTSAIYDFVDMSTAPPAIVSGWNYAINQANDPSIPPRANKVDASAVPVVPGTNAPRPEYRYLGPTYDGDILTPSIIPGDATLLDNSALNDLLGQGNYNPKLNYYQLDDGQIISDAQQKIEAGVDITPVTQTDATRGTYDTMGIFGKHTLSYGWGGLYEGISWAIGVTAITGFLTSMLPDKQQGLVKPFGQALAAGLFVGRTTWGLVKQFGGTTGTATQGKLFGKISAGTTGFVAGALVSYFVFANQYTKTKDKEASIEFKCLPWQAPLGGADCNKCNSNAAQPCSEYRCKSLGQTCVLLNQGTGFERCIDSSPNDVTSPGIKPWKEVLTKGYKYTDVQDRPPGGEATSSGHMKIVDEKTDGCLKAFTAFDFGIVTTDKGTAGTAIVTQPAQCKVDFNHTLNFDAMSYYLDDNNLYIENHTQRVSLPGTDLLNKTFPGVKNNGDYTLYIRCRDGNGNENRDEFAVRFCIDKSPDLSAPVISKVSIPSGSPVLYKIDNVSVSVYTNEPSSCRWDRKDGSYSNMNNQMTCSNQVWQMNADLLYECKTTLTGIKDRENNDFYFRCTDLSNNTMQQSQAYRLIGTQPLDILSTSPSGTIKSSTSTATLSLGVKTDNGYKNGEATCFYSNTGIDKDYIAMFETNTNTHKQDLDLVGGNYTYYFKCVDAGGNTAYNKTNFLVDIDKTAPVVSRVYSTEGKLIVVTNEDSQCSYSTSSCNFKISEGINMPYDNSVNHYAEWKTEQSYYIKCQDNYGNQPSPTDCSIVIRPYSLAEEEL